ncbi:MAG: SRPBCC family protein [Candidatus Omnitrophota bacterium]|nr:SRPBCC family protein [Candidatus Omnitrophota bacterium]
MGQIQKQLFFKARLEKVWQIWTDVENTPEWVEGVSESTITSSVRSGRGLGWQEKCLVDERVVQMDHEMIEWEEGKKTKIRTGLPMGGSINREVEFKETKEGTEVNVCLEWDLGMIGAFVQEERVQRIMEKGFDRSAVRWKEKAEKN